MVFSKIPTKSILFILAVLFFLNILAWIVVFNLRESSSLEVIFFDVGQGDAIFIITPQKHQILIDGGPDSSVLEKLAETLPFWDRSIDLVILTHPEHDHMAGLIEVLKQYEVENILWTGVVRETIEYKEWLKVIQKEGAEINIAKAGQKIRAGKVEIDILHPFEDLKDIEVKNSNDTSIISRLVFKENSFLFTGDATKSAERKLIDYCEQKDCILDSDILKVGHHGSKTSTSDEFLENVLPKIAVIQVGKNKYGHPTFEVLERLAKFGIRVLRTDELGSIKIISDGKNLK